MAGVLLREVQKRFGILKRFAACFRDCRDPECAERIVCGTDGTEFGREWTTKALAEARIGEDARAQILHRNATAMLSRLAKVAQRETVAA